LTPRHLFQASASLTSWPPNITPFDDGGLMFLGTSVNACITKMHEEGPWGFYVGWMLAFLFLTSGSLKIAVNPTASRRAIKAAGILALVFAFLALASLGGCFGLGAYKKLNG
jgi:hypothetical protein